MLKAAGKWGYKNTGGGGGERGAIFESQMSEFELRSRTSGSPPGLIKALRCARRLLTALALAAVGLGGVAAQQAWREING